MVPPNENLRNYYGRIQQRFKGGLRKEVQPVLVGNGQLFKSATILPIQYICM